MSFKDTHKFRLSLINSQYFHVEIKDDVEIEIEDIQALVGYQNELGGGKKYPVLISTSASATTNSDTLRYLAKKDSLPYTVADAFVITSIPHQILAKIYTKIISTSRPTGIFIKEEEALAWLKKFISKET